MGESALLILEGPWWTPADKPKRPSVLPFLEGLEQFKGNFNIYHSNFYETKGFRRALEDDLVHTREDRLFLYIAAHGGSRMVGAMESESGQAKEQNVDLLVFPELSPTGYVLQDLVATVAHRPVEEDPVFRHLLQASRDLDLVVGFVDEDLRHRFFIASAYLSGGKVIHVHHKLSANLRPVRRRTLLRLGRFGPGLRHPFWARRPVDL